MLSFGGNISGGIVSPQITNRHANTVLGKPKNPILHPNVIGVVICDIGSSPILFSNYLHQLPITTKTTALYHSLYTLPFKVIKTEQKTLEKRIQKCLLSKKSLALIF